MDTECISIPSRIRMRVSASHYCGHDSDWPSTGTGSGSCRSKPRRGGASGFVILHFYVPPQLLGTRAHGYRLSRIVILAVVSRQYATSSWS